MKLFLLFIFICGARAKVSVRDSCLSSPCHNGGTCLNQNHEGENYFCACNGGFSGKNCEIVDDHCLSNPCQNGGSCLGDESAYICTCKDGYIGQQCENADPCRSQPCQNDGYCSIYNDEYKCDCRTGFSGKNCETADDPCLSNPCQNGGGCLEDGNAYKCICKDVYIGKQCESIDPCRSQPCQNDGYCSTYRDEYKCKCRIGFSGKNCETVVTSSATTARLFRTSDQSTWNTDSTEAGRYSSQFPMSTGDPFDPCHSQPCQNGGYCWRIKDKYICDCTVGFTGKSCEKNSTEAGRYSSHFPLSTRDPLTDASSQQHFFSTDEAFTKSPFASTSVFQTTLDCRCENGLCTIDIYGNLKCVCHPQYAKIDDGRCTPCDCGQDANCEFVREGGRVRKHCFCPMGYEDSNGRCTDIDECIHNRHCPPNTECQNTRGSYDCLCSEGYRPYNRSSEVKADGCIEVCSSNACVNGQCKIDGYSYFCKCDNGFTGRHCEEKIDSNRIMDIIEIQSPWITLSALLLIIFLAFIFIHRNKSVKKNTFVFTSSDDKCPLFEDRKNERIGETGESSKQCSILQKKSPV